MPIPTTGRFIGVDLAWGRRNPSGLCLVEHGRAVESALLRDDDELLGWLEPRTRGSCVVAFDAPLIIGNDAGARACERAITRRFARFEAGCYPSNRTRVAPRALQLASRLGLSPDFRATGRCAIEVYPHAALVNLFGLDRTLKYKARRGRTIAARHAAFRDLTARLQTLEHHDPPLAVRSAPRWAELVRTATTSRVGAQLDRAEDEIDAFVCAHLAQLHRIGRTEVVGTLGDGYVVIPRQAVS